MTVTTDSYLDLPTAAWITSRVNAARSHALQGLRERRSGVEIAETLTTEVETVVLELCRYHLEQAKAGAGLAVMATGGFGRREFAPHSDLDLVFLCADTPSEQQEEIARSILVPLWDAKLDAGHAMRSLEEALELPATDLTAATGILDARFLGGDRALADRFLALYGERVAGSAPGSFVARLREEQETRHSRFGATIYLLEPDLKNGPGGLRDLCAGRWAAQAHFGSSQARVLQDLGEMSPRQAASFEAAREWLLRVRTALHLAAGRRQDQLRFDLQEKVALILYPDMQLPPGDARPTVAPAVEALMHHFQRHARAIRRETSRLMVRSSADPQRTPVVEPVWGPDGAADPGFEFRDGLLEVKNAAVFEKRPSEMLRTFQIAIDRDAQVGMFTTDLIMENAALWAGTLREDPASARAFFDVLTDVRDRATPSRLELMQDLGLLGALMPEWEPVTGRVQHDLYHVYTVDQHSLYAVAVLKALARKEHVDHYPRPTEELQLVEGVEALFLSVLLHDVGKYLGKNHSAKGAALAGAIAERLGLDVEDVRRVEFLVLHHLTMGHTSQRRDLDDPGLIAHFADLCVDEEGLRQLFLMTFTDLWSTAPGNLTSWKDELLRDLFDRTLTYLRRGPDLLMAERAELIRRRQKLAAHHLGEVASTPEMAAIFASLPDRYFTENSVSRIAAHVRLVRERRGPCAMHVSHQPRRGYSELVVVADDVPGLLAKLTGVLFANRIDILDAAIYSREPVAGCERGEALDIFRIRRGQQGAVTEESRLLAIRRDLEAVLQGEITVEELVASRTQASSMFDRAKPEVPPTEVRIDNEISGDFTVVDVFTEDRPGVLYQIARTLHAQGLDIHRSKVGVEADRVADIFYVRDKATGRKITDQARLEALKAALTEALPTPLRAQAAS